MLTIEQLRKKYGDIGFKLDLKKEIDLEEILTDLGFIKMDMTNNSQYLHLEFPKGDYFHIRLDWKESLDEVKKMDKDTYLEKFANKMIEQISDYTEKEYDEFAKEDKKWLLQRLIFTGLMMYGIKSNIEARNHKHNNRFLINEKQFLEVFSVLEKEHKYIVITGQKDPTQQKELVDKIIKIAKEQNICSKIELQTKDIDYYIDDILMCYSLSTHREFNKLKDKGYKKYRAVFIVSDKLKFDNLDLSNVYQATFKQMQYSEDEKTNEYITKHRLSNVEIVLEVEKLKSKFPNCSIRYDLDCQKADSRYHILRSDGRLYSNWEAFDPIQIIFSKDMLGTSYWLEKDYIDKLIEDLFDYKIIKI